MSAVAQTAAGSDDLESLFDSIVAANSDPGPDQAPAAPAAILNLKREAC